MTGSLKRRVASLLLLVMLVFGALILPGCHGSRNRSAFSLPETFDESRPISITFWAKNDTNKVQTAIYEKAIRDFEALYPSITVTMRLYTDYGRIYNDVITNIATDTTPNVCITYPDHIATYLTGSDVVVPLDDLLTDPRYGLGGSEIRFDSPKKEEVVPEFLQECSIGGQIYALPYMRSTEACYVNKTFVEKLGYTLPEVLTWDFVWEVSDAAAKKDSSGTYLVNGQKVMIPFLYKSTDNMMIQMLRQLDAGYSDENGKIEIFNDTTRSLLQTIAEHVKQGSFSTFKISSYPANFLNAGQCVFAVDSTAGSTWMGTNAPLLDISADKVVDFETVVMTIPQFDPSHQRMISQGPSVCMFNKPDRQEVLASWLFLQYLLSNEVQIAYAETEGYVPVTLKAQQAPEYQDYLSRIGEDNNLYYDVKILASQLLLSHTEDTFVTPVFNGSASLRDAAGQMIENVTKSVRRKEAVNDAYYEKLYADMVSLYHLNLEGTGASASSRQELGPLPHTAVVLLTSIACAWLLIALYFCVKQFKKRKAEHS
ncbi:MAG: extracellular solute-binding protein [Oscillospiraceae bacterium]|nr:extracellular solute-binding protein [Oscillospiraceae bacterium]